ncbi:hypothetical protein JCM10450v2_002297 [Rhodotorula kratochvilovae]
MTNVLTLDLRDSAGAVASTLYRSAKKYTCAPYVVTFSGLNGPLDLTVVRQSDEGNILSDFGNYTAGGVAQWTVNVPAGENVQLKLADSAGNERFTAPALVKDGHKGAPGCSKAEGDKNNRHDFSFWFTISIVGLVIILTLATLGDILRKTVRVRNAVRPLPAADAAGPAPDAPVEMHALERDAPAGAGVAGVQRPVEPQGEVDLGRPDEEAPPPRYDAAVSYKGPSPAFSATC